MTTVAAPRTSTGQRTAARLLLVAAAALALLAGLDAGLVLLDVPAPVSTVRLQESHGVLMVLGFVGSLVALERAVALRHPLALVAPAGLAVGALLQLGAATATTGSLLLVVGALALVLVYVPLWRRQRDDAVLVQALGAALAVGAVLLWRAGVAVPSLLPWLAGFLVLTIVGERLELARIAMPARAGGSLLVAAAGFATAVAASTLWPTVGRPLVGLGLATLCAWLMTYDVARRTVRGTGLARYLGATMLLGQGWLAVAAGVWLLGGGAADSTSYDAVVHATFLGFTMSMVMAHAPVILPAVARTRLPYHPVMYLPVALLQLSLLTRLWLGDAFGWQQAWQVGGAGNVLAVLSFLGTVVWSVVRGRRAS